MRSFEKGTYYNWQAYWSDQPMVRASVLLNDAKSYKWRPYDTRSHWNFEGKAVDTVFVISNQPEVELFQNGKSLGRQKVDPNVYQAIYTVDYKPGKLEARAYEGKKVVASQILKTAGEAMQLGLVNQRANARYTEDELLFLTLEVQDKKGIRSPYADNQILVAVEGGELIGLDSGDPFSHELFKQNTRQAYEGRLLLTVRPKGTGGLKVVCTTPGLKDAEMTIVIH